MSVFSTQFGGNFIAPKLNKHLTRAAKSKVAVTAPKAQFGGGLIAPKLMAHVKRRQPVTK